MELQKRAIKLLMDFGTERAKLNKEKLDIKTKELDRKSKRCDYLESFIDEYESTVNGLTKLRTKRLCLESPLSPTHQSDDAQDDVAASWRSNASGPQGHVKIMVLTHCPRTSKVIMFSTSQRWQILSTRLANKTWSQRPVIKAHGFDEWAGDCHQGDLQGHRPQLQH